MHPIHLTTAQALIRFLKNQSVELDGEITPFFAGCLGIFGHVLLLAQYFRYVQTIWSQWAFIWRVVL